MPPQALSAAVTAKTDVGIPGAMRGSLPRGSWRMMGAERRGRETTVHGDGEEEAETPEVWCSVTSR